MDGRDGKDVIRAGPGDDRISGGAGVDMADFADASLAIQASLTDHLPTGLGNDRIVGIENLAGSRRTTCWWETDIPINCSAAEAPTSSAAKPPTTS